MPCFEFICTCMAIKTRNRIAKFLCDCDYCSGKKLLGFYGLIGTFFVCVTLAHVVHKMTCVQKKTGFGLMVDYG